MNEKGQIQYVKPEVLDLGPTVVVHSASCTPTGNNATTTCPVGSGPDPGSCAPLGNVADANCGQGNSPNQVT